MSYKSTSLHGRLIGSPPISLSVIKSSLPSQVQQGDPLRPVLFALSIDDINKMGITLDFNVWFVFGGGGIYVHCSHRCKHGWRVWSQWSLSKPSKCEFWFLNRSVSQYQPTIDLLLQFHLLPIGLLFPWSSNHWPCLSVHLLIEGGYPWTIAEIYWSYRTPTRFFFHN